MKYRFVGDHAEVLDGGQPIAPGDFVEVDGRKDPGPHTHMLIEQGVLIPADKSTDKATPRKKEGD